MTRPQDACTYCGSTDFEEVDGLLYCHNGHAQEGGQQVDAEDDYARSGKISRQKDVKEKQKVLKSQPTEDDTDFDNDRLTR